MNTINNPVVRQYYITIDGDKVTGYGYVDPGQRLDTNTPLFETYTDPAVWSARLAELGTLPDELWTGELPTDVNQARLILMYRLNIIRSQKIVLDVAFMGHPFQNDATASQNLSGVVAYVAAGGRLPDNFCWRSSDNIDVPMSSQTLLGLAGTLLAYRNACYTRSWELKAQLEASDDPKSIDITAGWPNHA